MQLFLWCLGLVGPSVHMYVSLYIREAATKSSFFSGPATKDPPPQLDLSGHIFGGNFFGASKVLFLSCRARFLVAGTLKKIFFAATPTSVL